jgi:hypothetical protein
MPKVYNIHLDTVPPGAVYVGRGSSFGNPFVINRDGSRDTVIAKFTKYLRENPRLRDRIRKELRGRDLICFCAPKSCHGDVLLEVANGKPD